MHIILGATGRVGSVVALTLLSKQEPVTIVTHDPTKIEEWMQKGATVAVADVHDTDSLRSVFQRGQRLFLLNPPAPPSSDTAREERRSVHSILEALSGSGIKKIVAQSTYGAQPGDQIGDLGVLYELEQGLAQTGIPTTIMRAAYFMSNWDMALTSARHEGKLYSYFPPDFRIPMVAPQDLGQQAARLLLQPIEHTGFYYVEGPQMYSSADVAAAFANALNRPVEAVSIPAEQWISSLQEVGFSAAGAESMAAMTALTLEKPDTPDSPIRGQTTLQEYVDQLVASQSSE